MINKIDLHTHSTMSDGTCTPVELARLAKKVGLTAIALTDHDTVSGVKEFVNECGRLGIEGITGVEIGTKFKRELHIVGLYVGGDEFETMMSRLRDGRKTRNIEMLNKLRENGYDIKEEDIVDEEIGATIESVGRVHMANALVAKGYVKDRNEAFAALLGKGKACYVSRFALTPKESVEFIKRSGGIAIWAHPVYTANNFNEIKEIALELKQSGLDAIECYYSGYDDNKTNMCLNIAEETGLLASGGSDFHGENKPDVELGKVNGGFVPYEILEKMKNAIM